MTKQQAKTQMIIGFVFAIIGFIIGLKLPEDAMRVGSEIGKAFLCAYILWSLYWGVKIVYEPIMKIFPMVFYSGSNVFDIMSKYFYMQLTLYLVILGVGYIVGALGGAIVKNILLIVILVEA